MPNNLTAPGPKDVERFFESFPLLPAEVQRFLIDLADKSLNGTMSTEEVIAALRERMPSRIS